MDRHVLEDTGSGGAADLSIRVECYAGYRGDEAPARLFLGMRRVDVQEVVDRWLAPDHAYFKVRAEDGSTYIVRHDTVADRWELTMFDSGRHVTG